MRAKIENVKLEFYSDSRKNNLLQLLLEMLKTNLKCRLVSSDLGIGPNAGSLDAQVVLVHLDPEEPVFAPIGSPAVAPDPVLFTEICSINNYLMMGAEVTFLLLTQQPWVRCPKMLL